MNKPSGFTLNELLVVVIIIALLSTFATETYVRTYEKSKGMNAIAIIRMIRAAERMYYMDWNRYAPLTYIDAGCGPTTSGLVVGGYIQCPNLGTPQDRAFNYTVSAPIFLPLRFIVVARRTGTGRYGGILGRTIIFVQNDAPPPPSTGWSGTWPADWRPQ